MLYCYALKRNMQGMASTARRRLADKSVIPLDNAKIRKLRLAAGLTLAEAATRAGIGRPQMWSDIEQGRRKNLTIDTLERIARVLNVRPGELLK